LRCSLPDDERMREPFTNRRGAECGGCS
jgi:hypothetical protein